MGTCAYQIKKNQVCGKPDIGDSGLCSKHGGKVGKTESRTAIFNLTQEGGTVLAGQTAEQAKEWLRDKVDQAQSANLPAMIGAMQDGEANGRTKKSSVLAFGDNSSAVFHASQGAAGKAGALTVFWVEYTKAVVTIIAVGAHSASSSYDIAWSAPAWRWGASVRASDIA